MATTLFEELVSCSGLAPLLAADVMNRVCVREGVEPATLTREQLMAVLPAIEKGLRLYLGPVALKMSMQRLRALATPAPSPRDPRSHLR